ncbi:MAG: PAS domain S-box protein [Candidatus Eremiobacteraeota bacterium]|nr:PAS domain S-box protein [Candidatus Eremiobacteraeota bacterium]
MPGKKTPAGAARENEMLEAMRSIVNRSPVVLMLWRNAPGEWPVEYVSENILAVTGYSREDLLSGIVSWTAITHKDDLLLLEAEVASFMEKGIDEWSQQYRLLCRSGEMRWFRDWNRVLRDSEGTVTHVQALVVDITAERQVLHDLAVKSAAIDATVTPIALGDLNGVVTAVNPAFLRLWGYEREEEVIRRSYLDFFDDPIAAAGILPGIMRQGSWEGEMVIRRKDGSTGEVFFTATMVRSPDDGTPLCLMASFIDVTHRRNAERSLMQSEQTLRSILEASPDAIFLVNIEKVILYGNITFAGLLGMPPAHLAVATPLKELFPGETGELLMRDLEQVFSKRRLLKSSDVLIEAGGKGRSFEPRLIPVNDHNGKMSSVIGIFRDVTGEREAERVLKRSHEELESLVRARTAELESLAGELAGEIALRKETEEKLQESYEKFRVLLDVPYVTAFLIDCRGTVVAANKMTLAALNLDQENFVGKNAFECIPPEIAANRRLQVEKVLRSGQPHQFVDQRDGRWIESSLYPVFNTHGKVVMVAVFGKDVTEEKKHLNEREELIASLQKALADVKTLSGLLPVCAWCRKVRNDEGYWQMIEDYVTEHSGAEISHSICPDCAESYFHKVIPPALEGNDLTRRI